MARTPQPLPSVPTVATIERRLALIFPEGTPNRATAIAERAARTAFVFLYVGAVEGTDIWVRPDQVTRMSDRQATKSSQSERMTWSRSSLAKRGPDSADCWYSVNSREGIRDDTLRHAWQPLGVVVERKGLSTTSSTPRWALAKDFAALLTWGHHDDAEQSNISALEQSQQFASLLSAWQTVHLSREARARIQVMRRVTGTDDSLLVTLPDGSIRRLGPGDSSRIAKAVIEHFAPRFLSEPAVLWLSESREHVSVRDNELAESIGLNISDSGILPDIILIDTNPDRLILVFCEVVATDGPMNESRKRDIERLVEEAGFDPSNVALVTAFLDRDSPQYRKLVSALAWGSFAWTASEPDKLTVHLDCGGRDIKLTGLLDILHTS